MNSVSSESHSSNTAQKNKCKMLLPPASWSLHCSLVFTLRTPHDLPAWTPTLTHVIYPASQPSLWDLVRSLHDPTTKVTWIMTSSVLAGVVPSWTSAVLASEFLSSRVQWNESWENTFLGCTLQALSLGKALIPSESFLMSLCVYALEPAMVGVLANSQEALRANCSWWLLSCPNLFRKDPPSAPSSQQPSDHTAHFPSHSVLFILNPCCLFA